MEYITKHEIERMIQIASEKSLRDHLILLLAFHHALRRAEVANLRIGDVSDGVIRVKRVKGSLATCHPLVESPNPLFNESHVLSSWLNVSEWIRQRPNEPADSLFSISGDWVNRLVTHYALAAGVRRELAHSHSLKHACCKFLSLNGLGVEYIQQIAGHKDIKNTIIYMHISGAEAMEKAQKVFSKG